MAYAEVNGQRLFCEDSGVEGAAHAADLTRAGQVNGPLRDFLREVTG